MLKDRLRCIEGQLEAAHGLITDLKSGIDGLEAEYNAVREENDSLKLRVRDLHRESQSYRNTLIESVRALGGMATEAASFEFLSRVPLMCEEAVLLRNTSQGTGH